MMKKDPVSFDSFPDGANNNNNTAAGAASQFERSAGASMTSVDSPHNATSPPILGRASSSVFEDASPNMSLSTTPGLGSTTTLSRIQRMRQQGGLPTLDMQAVERTKAPDEKCGDAAHCDPMTQIDTYLWLGSWRDACNAEALRANKITHILNVAKEVPRDEERRQMESTACVHKTIPLEDNQHEDLSKFFVEAHDFIRRAEQEKGTVLVHCRRGISRSAAIVVSYLMCEKNMPYTEAVQLVKNRRASVSLNLAFRMLLEAWVPGTPMRVVPTSTTMPRRASSDDKKEPHEINT